jgi:hypothetical protein
MLQSQVAMYTHQRLHAFLAFVVLHQQSLMVLLKVPELRLNLLSELMPNECTRDNIDLR